MDTLIAALRSSAILKARSLEATLEDDGSVTIHRRGHMRGLWRGTGTEYAYYAAGSNEAQHVVTSLDDVVHITERLFKRRADLRDPSYRSNQLVDNGLPETGHKLKCELGSAAPDQTTVHLDPLSRDHEG